MPLPSGTISHARGHLRVSRFVRRTTEKRETARSLTCILRLKRRRLNKNKYYPFGLENTVKTAFVSMESIFERDFLKINTAFEKSTHGKWKMDLFSNRLGFNLKIGWVDSLSLSFWKLLEGDVFEIGAGDSRIYLSCLGCKFDFFSCLLVMIKTNSARK